MKTEKARTRPENGLVHSDGEKTNLYEKRKCRLTKERPLLHILQGESQKRGGIMNENVVK